MEKYDSFRDKFVARKERKRRKLEKKVDNMMFELYYKCYCDTVKKMTKQGQMKENNRYKQTKAGEIVDMVRFNTKNKFNRKINRKVLCNTVKESGVLLGGIGMGLCTYGIYNNNLSALSIGMILSFGTAINTLKVVKSTEPSEITSLYDNYIASKHNSSLMTSFADRADKSLVLEQQNDSTKNLISKIR